MPWFWEENDEEEEPYLRKILIDREIFEKALQRGKEEETEIGFYMVGLITNRIAYVYDVLEFPYLERTGASVASNPENLGTLFSAVPAGLEVVGLMHKHPEGIGPSYSSIDKKTFLKWSKTGEKGHLIFSGENIEAYTVKDGEVREIEFKVKDLKELSPLTLEFPMRMKLFVPAKSRVLDVTQTLEKEITSETLKRFSPVKFKGKKIMEEVGKKDTLDTVERKVLHVMSPNQEQFTYRFFVSTGETFGEVKKKILSTLSLPPHTEFYTEEARILDKTPITELTGRIIYPRESIREIIAHQISKERLKETIKGLTKQVEGIQSELEELKSEIHRVKGQKREQEGQRKEKEEKN